MTFNEKTFIQKGGYGYQITLTYEIDDRGEVVDVTAKYLDKRVSRSTRDEALIALANSI